MEVEDRLHVFGKIFEPKHPIFPIEQSQDIHDRGWNEHLSVGGFEIEEIKLQENYFQSNMQRLNSGIFMILELS